MIHLDYREGRPIYEQIVARYREQIAAGVLQEGDRLPSVRELASQLAINANTIQRAYRELEAQGCIVTVPGKGCFVCPPQKDDRDGLWAAFDRAAAALLEAGTPKEALILRLQEGIRHD